MASPFECIFVGGSLANPFCQSISKLHEDLSQTMLVVPHFKNIAKALQQRRLKFIPC